MTRFILFTLSHNFQDFRSNECHSTHDASAVRKRAQPPEGRRRTRCCVIEEPGTVVFTLGWSSCESEFRKSTKQELKGYGIYTQEFATDQFHSLGGLCFLSKNNDISTNRSTYTYSIWRDKIRLTFERRSFLWLRQGPVIEDLTFVPFEYLDRSFRQRKDWAYECT